MISILDFEAFCVGLDGGKRIKYFSVTAKVDDNYVKAICRADDTIEFMLDKITAKGVIFVPEAVIKTQFRKIKLDTL